jgi:hypothetical protein
MRSDTGTVRGEGRIVSMGRRVAFTEASLTDRAGQVYASATSNLTDTELAQHSLAGEEFHGTIWHVPTIR